MNNKLTGININKIKREQKIFYDAWQHIKKAPFYNKIFAWKEYKDAERYFKSRYDESVEILKRYGK